jgi:DNA-binding XRE family transcriptional regulator
MKTISALRRKPTERTRIKQLREEAGIGLREMCKFAELSPATLSRVESGKAPDIRTALKLAKFFETSVENLFGSWLNRERV